MGTCKATLCIFYEALEVQSVCFSILWNNGVLKFYYIKIKIYSQHILGIFP